MRIDIVKRHSTKAERIFYELLKKNRIPFRFREEVNGREIDFLIGKYAIEIDGHEQSSRRNKWLIDMGFIPLHYSNNALYKQRDEVEKQILRKCLTKIQYLQ